MFTGRKVLGWVMQCQVAQHRGHNPCPCSSCQMQPSCSYSGSSHRDPDAAISTAKVHDIACTFSPSRPCPALRPVVGQRLSQSPVRKIKLNQNDFISNARSENQKHIAYHREWKHRPEFHRPLSHRCSRMSRSYSRCSKAPGRSVRPTRTELPASTSESARWQRCAGRFRREFAA